MSECNGTVPGGHDDGRERSLHLWERRDGDGVFVLAWWAARVDLVSTASWCVRPVGMSQDPVAWRIQDLRVGVHDSMARWDGDVVGAARCVFLQGRTCFWRPSRGELGVLTAYLEGGRARLREALEQVAYGALDQHGALPHRARHDTPSSTRATTGRLAR